MKKTDLKAAVLAVLIIILAAALTAACGSASLPAPENARIGAVNGMIGYNYASAAYPNARLQAFDSVPDMVEALAKGKIDYAVNAYTTLLSYQKNTNQIKLYGKALDDGGAYLAVAKDNEELYKKIDNLITQYKNDGTLDQIKADWIECRDYTVEEIPEVENGPELIIATCVNREPMEFYLDNKISGFDPELMRRMAYDLGMKPVFTDMAFSGMIAALQTGKADVIAANLAYTEERAKQVNFTQRYLDNPQYLAVRADTAAGETFFEKLNRQFYGTFVKESRWKMILGGLGVTVSVSFCAAIIGSLLGLGLCIQGRSSRKSVRIPKILLSEIVTGVPTLVILMILYYVIFAKIAVPAIIVSIICFSITFAVTVCGLLETGLSAVDKGELEAASALGYTKRQVFMEFALPQAVRQMLPMYQGSFVMMFKLTSIVGYIAVADLTKVSDILRSLTFDAFFPLITTAIIYFAASRLISVLIGKIRISVMPPFTEADRRARLKKIAAG